MNYELQATTPAGKRLVALAEDLAAQFARRAEQHDREGAFAIDNINALHGSGYFAAPIPTACGGMGVESVHDLLVASGRLARGDASTTIGVNMHLGNALRMVRRWQEAEAAGDRTIAARVRREMEQVGAGQLIIAATLTEAGRELTEPATTATRTETGWIINGHKVFATMAQAATHLTVSATYTNEAGEERLLILQAPADSPGVRFNDDWDALGMRASGSGSVTFTDVVVDQSAQRGEFRVGRWDDLLERFLTSGLFHASASLGIAEEAARQAVALASGGRKGRHGRSPAERPVLQQLAAESAIDLAAMRAVFARAGAMLDDFFAVYLPGAAPRAAVRAAFAEAQSANVFVNLAAIRIVDRALTMSGGAGYLTTHPLARLYRDVRAGPFMHPLATNTATEVIGRIALGLEPDAA